MIKTNGFGRKAGKGHDWGKKKDAVKKGVKTLGLALVAGAGIYAAHNSLDNQHQHNDAEKTSTYDPTDSAPDVKKVDMPKDAVGFAPAAGGVSPLDKAADVVDVLGTAVEAGQAVADEDSKFGKAKAAVGGLKEIGGKVKNIGKKNEDQKLVEGQLSDKRARKKLKKEQTDAQVELRKRDCRKKYPEGQGLKTAGKYKKCLVTGK